MKKLSELRRWTLLVDVFRWLLASSSMFCGLPSAGIVVEATAAGGYTFSTIAPAPINAIRLVGLSSEGSEAPITVVTRPGDPIVASSENSAPAEGVANAIDGQPTKYLNFDLAGGAKPAGFAVTPSIGRTVVTGLRLQSANDASDRDPKSVTLEGSNDQLVGSFSAGNWELIYGNEAIAPWQDRYQTQVFEFKNTKAYKHYRWTVWSTQGPSTCCMQIAEVELLGVVALPNQPLTRPGDPVLASSLNSPASEGAPNAIDDSPGKYLNFDLTQSGGLAGFVVTPLVGGTVVAAISLQSANDAPDRDPKSVTLEGSNDELIESFSSGNWELIYRTDAIPPWQNRQQTQVFEFNNTNPYKHYRWTVWATQGPSTCCMQIAEVELLGTVGSGPTEAPPSIVAHPLGRRAALGTEVVFTAAATGTKPLAYQWQKDSVNIPGATNVNLTLAAVQPNAAGKYRVIVGNSAGSARSEAAPLGILAMQEDFESPAIWDNWLAEGGTWQIAAPGAGPGSAYRGSKCALTGRYENNVDARLISPQFLVPPAEFKPSLRFWHWIEIASGDRGMVEVRAKGGTWRLLAPAYSGSSGGTWMRAWMDLSAYADQQVELAFRCKSDNAGNAHGWFLDALEVVTAPDRILSNPEGFESEAVWDNWIAEGGTWRIGMPSPGPGRAYVGSACAMTGLYGSNIDARLVSPPLTVPGALAQPILRFWHWYKLGAGDQGTVEIKPANGTWQALSPAYSGSSGGAWTRARLDLTEYAGQTVQLGFHFKSNADSDFGPGWHIDDFLLQANVLFQLEDKAIDEEQLLVINLPAQSAGLEVGLVRAPAGMAHDSALGLLTWSPSERQGPGRSIVEVQVTDPVSSILYGATHFTINIDEINQSPTIDFVSDAIIQAGRPLTFPITAFDPDSPANELTFSLDTGAPVGASIDPRTGLFTWTPTALQALANHAITVRVTDNGSPPLSSTAIFQAGPGLTEPQLAISRGSDGGIELLIRRGSAGSNYVVEFTPELRLAPSKTIWTTLMNLTPDHFPFAVEVPQRNPDATTIYFRLLQQP